MGTQNEKGVSDTDALKDKRHSRTVENVIHGIFLACGVIVIGFVLAISIYLVVSGIPAIVKIGFGKFIFGTEWASTAADPKFGILPFILSSVYGTCGAVIIGVPIGLFTAVFLTKVASPKAAKVIREAVNLLAGIPSVIYGLVGMIVFMQAFGLKAGLLAGSLTLVMMITPIIVRTTQEALKTVPDSYREGALALGSGKWHMIRTVVLPNAIDGILTGCILAIGRITGESAALLFTAGMGLALNDFFTAMQSSSATLTVALYLYASENGEVDTAFAIAVVLMIITLLINFAAGRIGKRKNK